MTAEELTQGLTRLIRKLFSQIKPVKRPLEGPFRLRVPTTRDELVEYLRLRYQVYGAEGMNVIPPALHNEAGLEVDCFDKYAIPFGVYQHKAGEERLVACLRIVTRSIQEPFASHLASILSAPSVPALVTEYHRETGGMLPTEESYDATDMYAEVGIAPGAVVEFSRNIVQFAYRGSDLSRFVFEYGIAWCRTAGIH